MKGQFYKRGRRKLVSCTVNFCFPCGNFLRVTGSPQQSTETEQCSLGNFFRRESEEVVQSTLKHKGMTEYTGPGWAPDFPPASSHFCTVARKETQTGEHPSYGCGLFSCVCKHNSEPVSREGKTYFSSLAWVTSGCAQLCGKATSGPAVLISLMADLCEDMGIAAMPLKGWKAKGNAMPFLPCAFFGKGPGMPVTQEQLY